MFRKSDHAAISKRVNKLRCTPPVTREVRKWTGQSEAALQTALHDAVWNMSQVTLDVIEDINDSLSLWWI